MNALNTEFIYGLNPAFEVLRSNRRKIFQGFIDPSAGKNPRISKVSDLLRQKGVPLKATEKGRLIHLCGNRDHQSIVLETSVYPYVDFGLLLEQPRLLLLDNIEDPHNVGAILRSAEVFGFKALCIPRRGVPGIYPSVVKVSAGATEFLDISRQYSANQYARKAQEAGFRVVALDRKGQTSFEDITKESPEKLMLVIGGEDKSVGQFILNLADDILGIPQAGKINSLNASVSAGIAMYALNSKS